jgi:hypothetical protein
MDADAPWNCRTHTHKHTHSNKKFTAFKELQVYFFIHKGKPRDNNQSKLKSVDIFHTFLLLEHLLIEIVS